MKEMFDHSGYTYAEPTLERANERMKNRRNLRHAARQAIRDNPEWYKNNPQAKSVMDNSDLIRYTGTFLGGNRRRKTHKRKYKSKKKNISRKRKQSRRKGKKINKK